MITIKNMHNEKPKFPWDVKVDRTSILGNPYYLNNEANRNEVCDKYNRRFYFILSSNDDVQITFKKEIQRLKDIYKKYKKLNLFCWCVPKRCHAEIIKEYLEKDSSISCFNKNLIRMNTKDSKEDSKED